MELSLPDRAYQHIRAKLFRGDLGPGSRLDYKKLGKELGISTTPVREAMGKLASEGFVELVPRLGAMVRRLSTEEATELYELRECVEPFAAERAAQRMSDEQLRELRGYLDSMRALVHQFRDSGEDEMPADLLDRFHLADYSFHMLILHAAGNRRLEKVIADCHALERIFGSNRHLFTLQHVANAYGFHRRVYRALARRDSEAAKHWLCEHIRHGGEMTLAAYERHAQRERWPHLNFEDIQS